MIIIWEGYPNLLITFIFQNTHIHFIQPCCAKQSLGSIELIRKKTSFIPLLRKLKFKCHITMQWTIKLSTINSSISTVYLHDNKNHHDCMFLTCHVRVSQWIHTLQLPECQRTPYSKQTQNLKFKWMQLHSNLESLSS